VEGGSIRGRATTAFVLSGGANLGAEQAGMLLGLLETGIRPDVLVGTSIGAANAAYLGADPTLQRALELAELWENVRSRDIFPIKPFGIVRAIARGGSLFPTRPFRDLLERVIPYANIEDASVPLRIVATSFEDGSEVVFDSGSVVDAVLASTALPGVFAPHQIGDKLYLDGGLVDQVPLNPAIDAGACTLYVLSVGFPCPPPRDHRSARAVLMHSMGILLSQQVRFDGNHLPTHHPDLRVVQVPPVCSQVGLRDFSHARQMIEQARLQTIDFLATHPAPAPAEAIA